MFQLPHTSLNQATKGPFLACITLNTLVEIEIKTGQSRKDNAPPMNVCLVQLWETSKQTRKHMNLINHKMIKRIQYIN